MKVKLKQNLKSLAKALVFLLCLALMLQALSLTIFSKENALCFRNAYSKAYAYIDEPENSIDIVAVGNSDLYTAFVPMHLYENYGYTSDVISIPHQSMDKSYGLLKDFLKHQSPKFLILETDMFYSTEPESAENLTVAKEVSETTKEKTEKFFIPLNGDDFEFDVKNSFSAFNFHDRWKKIKPRDFFNAFKLGNVKSFHHGYNFSSTVQVCEKSANMIETDAVEPIPNDTLVYFEKIINLCEKNDISVILTEVPALNSWSYARHNAVSELAQNYGIEFVDFNLLFDDPDYNFDFNSDFRDGGYHLNFKGATKTTLYFAKCFNSEFSSVLEDKRNNPDYAYWRETDIEFCKDAKIDFPY